MHSVTQDRLLSPWEPNVFSLVIYGAIVIGIIAALLFIASKIGEKRNRGDKLLP
ncbi:MAG: hypothetical protein RBT11_11885 [Desulfobacterales bacterium]|jgi:hypothetical protein|nr:hypothetical protein [Desulfobacterales bacterium]